MAALALVLCADDRMVAPKPHVTEEVLAQVEALKGADIRLANNLLNSYSSGIRNQSTRGRNSALNAVAAIGGDAQAARLLIRICRSVGLAHGGLSPQRVTAIKEVSAALQVPSPGGTVDPSRNWGGNGRGPCVITIGNEKGGTGKSTTAMHLAVALLKSGHTVGTIDLDGRQATLSRYLRNREVLGESTGRDVAMPAHRRIESSGAANRDAAQAEESARLGEALAELAGRQFVIIDTPGSDSHLARLAHAKADMLITPINDTLLDIDILAHVDPKRREVLAPSVYCEMIWEQKKRQIASGRRPVDWIVMRNRLTHIESHNKRAIANLLKQLAKRIGFRCASGFGERVIFHELFLTGLTVLDLPDDRLRGWGNVSLSHARQEIHGLLLSIGMPESAIRKTALPR